MADAAKALVLAERERNQLLQQERDSAQEVSQLWCALAWLVDNGLREVIFDRLIA